VLQILKSLDVYMVVNFRVCGNNRDARKLTRTTTLIKNTHPRICILLAIYPEKTPGRLNKKRNTSWILPQQQLQPSMNMIKLASSREQPEKAIRKFQIFPLDQPTSIKISSIKQLIEPNFSALFFFLFPVFVDWQGKETLRNDLESSTLML
jgi:hypothetical protein